eukprot:jgi/Botrbrau1/16587/Bobra.0068s0018.2
MWFFYAVSLPLLAAAVAVGLVVMPVRGTSPLVLADVGLAWFAALSTLVLVPTDVASALQGHRSELLTVWWRVAYWYGFTVQLTLLPFHQEYADCGAFTVADRLTTSLRNNLIFYAILLATGAAGLLLLLLMGELEPSNIVYFCIAASNAVGLIAGMFLLGYGLVAVPQHLWRAAEVEGALRMLRHRAAGQAETAINARTELGRSITLVRKVSGQFNQRDPMRKFMDKITAMAESCPSDVAPSPDADVPPSEDLDYFDRQDLAKLRRRCKRAMQDYDREKELYIEIVRRYIQIQDIIRNKGSPGPFVSTLHKPLPPWLARLEWLWKCVLRGWFFRFLAILAVLMSGAVLVAEATISPKLPNLSVFSRLLHISAGNEFATEFLCFIMLAYPCAAAYYALYRLGRFSFYLLVPHHTGAFSLLANAQLMCRFAAPLAFHFMAGLAMPAGKGDARDVEDTVFYREFGQGMMRQPVIGLDFTTYLPLGLVPYVLLLSCNAFNRLSHAVLRSRSIEFEDEWETISPAVARGTALLDAEEANHAAGRPLGLTICESSGAGSGVQDLLPERPTSSKWMNWSFSKRIGLLRGEGARGEAEGRPGEAAPLSAADEARHRLAKAIGRSPDRPPRPSRGDRHAWTGDGREGESTSLLGVGARGSGPSGSRNASRTSTGELDSIFARMENQG